MSQSVGRARRGFFLASSLVAIGVASAMLPMSAQAQGEWPNKPVRIIVPYGPGQGADLLARLLAQELSGSLRQSFVVENRPGAGGNIGAAMAGKADPDGYTILLGTNATLAANEFLYSNLGYQPAKDFDAVAMLGLLPMVICTATDFPTNGIAKMVQQARAKPNTINVGLPSTTASVVFAQFVQSAQAPLFGVKYKTSAQSTTDVLGGQIPLVIDTVAATRTHIQSGKLRALGISSSKSSPVLEGVKPIADQGVSNFSLVAWDAFFVPRGTAGPVVARLSEHVRLALEKPALQRKLFELGIDPNYMNPAVLADFVKSERKRWGALIVAADLHAD
ncbi:tripartite tricarboxylate transporter substrate binding protein (plasmid) [Cupriavidus necator]|uniref:Tripartite tricarboxylate transporter substrate binding protein n=1 Tax=Cupriavidus necator TaxID=106590 RepID=A0A367P7E2_CUPNE|nr:tripartite tricarboxylate transporter substrate-binding protein [Cupriavidus necator]QQX89622.1 tripartite tricarboxylate transporter substrate binding protein [Cupriavidus necator]RCJ03761.1 tripartite tricarboxylate transporter substrate binding protein [Cupriavidus necator]